MVSIIVPVYNTAKYLKKCIDSLLAQTYSDVEIIIVDDGSTDKSLNICKEYETKDNRVKVLTKANGGQGSARNMGIDISTGEYIMFVDSDDWVDTRIVEILLSELKANSSDIAICNLYKTAYNSETIKHTVEERVAEKVLEGSYKKEIFDISTFPVAKLYKRELFIENEIRFPNHFFEDVAMLPIVYAHAFRISFVNMPLYIYRDQGDSTIHTIEHMYDRIKCMETLIWYFKKYGFYQQYENEIKKCLQRRSMTNLKMVRTMVNKKVSDFAKEQSAFMNSVDCKEEKIPRLVAFGSYNLMIASKILMGLEDMRSVEDYYGGESIISVMGKKNDYINTIRITHENKFRKKCLINDFSKRFARLNPAEFDDIDYVLIDFMEERYSVGECNGELVTLSEAFNEQFGSDGMQVNRIEFGTEIWKKKWMEACDEFIELLDKYIGKQNIVLVKMKLSEVYKKGEEVYQFSDIEHIRESNEYLEWCYEYFEKHCPQAKVVNVDRIKKYYTNYEFRHGCYPWHLCDSAYGLIRNEIVEVLGKDC